MIDLSHTPMLRLGALVTALGLGGFVAWAVLTELDGAVVTQGRVALTTHAQAVQHPEGGLVNALHVRDGAEVRAGDPILTLDGTELVAQHAIVARALLEALARTDRLLAESSGADEIAFRSDLRRASTVDPAVATMLAEETALFVARQLTLTQHAAQLDERARQTAAMASGRARQHEALLRQRDLAQEDLTRQSALLERGLTEAARVSVLEREVARIAGQIGEIEASVAEARSAIAGYELERLTRIATFREEAQAALRQTQPQIADLREQMRVIEQRRERLVLRAPMAGTVLELTAHTVGGVIAPGAVIASILPESTDRIVRVQIDPAMIDRVATGQSARVRFPFMGAMHTPETEGELRHVSADAVVDPVTGRRMFTAEIALAVIPGFTPQPGQPAEVLLRTDTRRPASFLLKPAADYLTYAMRER